jgi:hypothetical protein
MKSLSYLLIAVVITTSLSCESGKKHIAVVYTNQVDGRKIYSVIFADGKVMDGLYNEEIQHGIKTGEWEYNEDLVLSEIPNVSLKELD